MVFRKVEQGYLLRLERGEELVSCLQQFCNDQPVSAGFVSGLGGIVKAVVGYYNLERQKYVWRHIKNVRELVGLTGNISTVGDKPALHLHGTFTDTRNKAYGGHIKECEVGGTVEILIQTFKQPLTRKLDKQVGLPLLDL